MVWNDVELVDGMFYVVTLTNDPNMWVFQYKEHLSLVTNHHVCACIQCNGRTSHVYESGYVCSNRSINTLRPCTNDDLKMFFDYIDEWNFSYNLQTKKLKYVGL